MASALIRSEDPDGGRTPPSRLEIVVIFILMALLAASLCVRLDAPFWGSMEVTAPAQLLPAKNNLRYGLAYTRGFASLAPSGLEREEFERHWYRNHPSGSTLYTTAFFALFGESRAKARLSAIVIAVLTIPLFWYLGRVLESPAAGLWAALIYASAGVVVWNARVPSFLPMALFVMILTVIFYLRWLASPAPGKWMGILAGVFLGCQIGWCGFVFGGALAGDLALRDGGKYRRRALILLAVPPLCFAGFLAHMAWATGPQGLEEMRLIFLNRASEGSRLQALRVIFESMVTHIGVIAAGAAALAFVLPGALSPAARRCALVLAAYGAFYDLFFVEATVCHAFGAAWFVFPAVVVAAAVGLARLTARLRWPRARFGLRLVCVAAIAANGIAFGIFRHRQTTWYGGEKQVERVLKEAVPRSSWVAMPLGGLCWPSLVYETDCNIFGSITRVDQLRGILARTPKLYVIIPCPEDAEGFWAGLGPSVRKQLGIRRLDPDCSAILEKSERRKAGPYEVYVIDRRAIESGGR